MNTILTVACTTLKSSRQAVFLRSALIALLLAPLAVLHAADAPQQRPNISFSSSTTSGGRISAARGARFIKRRTSTGSPREQSQKASQRSEAQQLCEQTLNELLLGMRPMELVESMPLIPLPTPIEETADDGNA